MRNGALAASRPSTLFLVLILVLILCLGSTPLKYLTVTRATQRGLCGSRTPRRMRGSQIGEFAIVLPLVFFLLYGIFWFGRAFETYETLTRAAREAARMATAPTCATCGNTFYSNAALRSSAVDPILRAASLDPADLTDANFVVTHNVLMNPATSPLGTTNPVGDIGTAVAISYPLKLPFYAFNCCPVQVTRMNLGIIITTQVQMREEH